MKAPPADGMTSYFLSYARADQQVALRIADGLIAAGVELWVDQYDIRPSQQWDRAVEAAVRESRGMVVILSPRSAASANVADEISMAVDAKKHLIPVMIEACTAPLRITRVQFIDATRDVDGAIARCVAAIKGGAIKGGAIAAAVTPAAAALAPEVLAEAERRLTPLVGPIAGELVRRAAARAATADSLYADLAGRLPNEADRARFLAGVAANAPTTDTASPAAVIAPEAVETLTRALIHHLGPIAATLVAREQARATSAQDLRERLSLRIAGFRDRAVFLKDTARL